MNKIGFIIGKWNDLRNSKPVYLRNMYPHKILHPKLDATFVTLFISCKNSIVSVFISLLTFLFTTFCNNSVRNVNLNNFLCILYFTDSGIHLNRLWVRPETHCIILFMTFKTFELSIWGQIISLKWKWSCVTILKTIAVSVSQPIQQLRQNLSRINNMFVSQPIKKDRSISDPTKNSNIFT